MVGPDLRVFFGFCWVRSSVVLDAIGMMAASNPRAFLLLFYGDRVWMMIYDTAPRGIAPPVYHLVCLVLTTCSGVVGCPVSALFYGFMRSDRALCCVMLA